MIRLICNDLFEQGISNGRGRDNERSLRAAVEYSGILGIKLESDLLCGFVKSVDFTGPTMPKQTGERGEVVSQMATKIERNRHTARALTVLLRLVKRVDGNERTRRRHRRSKCRRCQQWARLSFFNARRRVDGTVWRRLSWNEIRQIVFRRTTVWTLRRRLKIRTPVHGFGAFWDRRRSS